MKKAENNGLPVSATRERVNRYMINFNNKLTNFFSYGNIHEMLVWARINSN